MIGDRNCSPPSSGWPHFWRWGARPCSRRRIRPRPLRPRRKRVWPPAPPTMATGFINPWASTPFSLDFWRAPARAWAIRAARSSATPAGAAESFLPPNFLPGFLRGNFEWAADVLPMYLVLPPAGAVWGGSIRPVIWQWNFTSAHKFAPYVAAVGGIVFTRENVPPGNTSQVNFTPGIAFGSNVFVKPHRALFVEGSIAHLSSASLGDRNPGYNVNFLFTVGYSWFKGGR